uniref:pre-rRNA processing protein FTSJ3 n=1 Tax=Oryzias sinensis TaxID=183150 RepID=A0A8C7XLJ3_9TELE
MGKKLKVGKTRKDKFYHLAKETGYRSRSSFKLIQLNRKFQFLQKARALVDLCAAPAHCTVPKMMRSSVFLSGVDLVPIRPIPNVVTLQEDITTEKCKQALRKELQTWKVDVVLNDGAPNVGANWQHDAFSQAHLTLMALKLACEFLNKGGTFVTKVFRSKDYQPLLWIFQQFFKKVQSTKPQASRNESAEIFVVCQGFLAPDKIDGKFFDPKHAFKEVEVQAKTVRDLITVKKPKAEGYTDGDLTLYHSFTVTSFLKAENPVDFLGKASEITFDSPDLESHSSTSSEIKECCRDIKVLGRKELRLLLNWRAKLRRYLAKKLKEEAKQLSQEISLSSDEEDNSEDEPEEKKEDKVEEGEDEDEEEKEMEKKLAELKAEEVAELRRKKRKLLKERRKQRERVELKMDLPGVSIANTDDTSLFSLAVIKKKKVLSDITKGDMQAADSLGGGEDDLHLSDEEEDDADEMSLASDLDEEDLEEVEQRQKELDKKKTKKKVMFTEEAEDEEQEGGLLVELEEKDEKKERETNLWFSKVCLRIRLLQMHSSRQPRLPERYGLVRCGLECSKPPKVLVGCQKIRMKMISRSSPWKVPVSSRSVVIVLLIASENGTLAAVIFISITIKKRWSIKTRNLLCMSSNLIFCVCFCFLGKKARILNAEGLALGCQIATSKKKTRDLVDNSFHRYAHSEDPWEVPEWFLDDERKHRQRPVEVTKEMVEEYKQKWKEINARPIKRVAEAKARKKRRMLKKTEQAKKKAEAVVNTVDISEREKMAQLKSIYKKAGLGKEKREVTYVVTKKGAGKKVRRPPGVKGVFKVVDGRMKKDMRGMQRKEQHHKLSFENIFFI